MPCTSQIFSPALIYWGFANDSDFDPTTFGGWDDTMANNLLALMQSGPAAYDPAGYFFGNPTMDPLMLGWFIVPDSLTTPATTTGFQYGLDHAVAPTTNVLDQSASTISPLWSDVNVHRTCEPSQMWNTFSPDNVANNWQYFLRDINGVSYRWYVFGVLWGNYNNQLASTGDFFVVQRTTGVSTVSTANIGWPTEVVDFTTKVIIADDTSFNATCAFGTYIGNIGTLIVEYDNAGPDTAPVFITGAEVYIFQYTQASFSNFLGTYEVTLFVST